MKRGLGKNIQVYCVFVVINYVDVNLEVQIMFIQKDALHKCIYSSI